MSALGASTSAIARCYRRYRCGVSGDIRDCGVGITPQMCNRVTNHGDMSTFSKPVLKRNLFTKKSSQQNTNVKCLINDLTITNLQQSLLCLDLNHITGSNNCTTAMESLAHAVDNTYKLCLCWYKSKTLSNKDLK